METDDINITKNRDSASNLTEKFIKEDCIVYSFLKQQMLKTVKKPADKIDRQLKKYLYIPLCLTLFIYYQNLIPLKNNSSNEVKTF
jgi:hypothetical protein